HRLPEPTLFPYTTLFRSIRVSVLVPDDSGERWRMRWAAGHRPESVGNFDMPIEGSMAGIAFATGELVYSANVLEDERFTAHPDRSEEHTSELQSLAYLVC